MLYDYKRWEPKPDVNSFADFVAWLESQPPDKEYDWSSPSACLLGQWCAHAGVPDDQIRDTSIELGSYLSRDNPFHEIALGDTLECTFGAALARARKLAHSS